VKKSLSELLQKFRNLLVEYGVTALVVHYVIFALVIVGFWAAIRLGWQPSTAVGSVGTWTAAYIMTKIVQPLRIFATLAVTPFIAKLYERVTGRPVGPRSSDVVP
jgi:Kef-type K+ transport system membrane component KefB